MRSDLARSDVQGVRRPSQLVAGLILAAAAQVAQAQQPEGAAAATIRARRELSNQAIARHDTAGIARIFDDNVIVVTSRSTKTLGRDANAKAFAEQFRDRPDVVYRRTPMEVSVFSQWAMASERGTWTGSWTDVDGKIEISGSYFAKWRQVNGSWRVESETYVPIRCSGGKYCTTAP